MTLHYKFPYNIKLDEVKELIKDRKEFILADKGDYMVANYVMAGKDTHPIVIENDRSAAILRELRGLIFDKESGSILARRFHKFFNYGEREDVMEIDLSKPHVILEKLDGAMITPFYKGYGGHVRWGSKMGETDVSRQVEEFIKNNRHYDLFADLLMHSNQTPIFEWVSRKQRIVIDYPEDRLVLIAIRDNYTGEYMKYESMVHAANKVVYPPIEVVRQYPGTIESMEHLVAETKGLTDQEGWVIRFDDGHMVKLKADQYLVIHRARDMLTSERKVCAVVLDGMDDDLYPVILPNDGERLRKYSNCIWNDINEYCSNLNQKIVDIIDRGFWTRKDLGLDEKHFSKTEKSLIFSCWQDAMLIVVDMSTVISYLRKNLNKNSAFEKNLEILKTRWKEIKLEDN